MRGGGFGDTCYYWRCRPVPVALSRLAVWLAKWFVVFLHHCSAWLFYLLGSVLLATAILSYLMHQSQGMEALQMLIGGFAIFMIPQVVGGVVVLLELAAVMLRQVWYI